MSNLRTYLNQLPSASGASASDLIWLSVSDGMGGYVDKKITVSALDSSLTSAVTSVNGLTGAVVLTTDNISQGTNKYFSNALAQAAITGGASSVVTDNLPVSRALVSSSSGKILASSTTAAEIGFVAGVTSGIQTQLDNKLSNITGLITAGTGIAITGSGTSGSPYIIASTAAAAVTSVTGTTNRITSTGGTTPVIDISASYVGQASIITVGTITTGTWSGLFGAVSGANLTNVNGATVSSANEATDTTCFPLFITASGTQTLATKNNAGFIYNSNTNALTATTFIGAVTGNATTATALATGRTISISGDLTYTSPSFDGTGNVTAAGTLATVNSNVGTFGSATQVGSFTVNGKGLITAASAITITPAISSITGLGTGIATFLATPSSANLAAAVTDETGTGLLVFGTAPTFASTITVGAASGTTGAVLLKGTTSGVVTLSVADVAGTWTMKLPTTGGTNGYSLTTDGSGNTTWTNITGGGSAIVVGTTTITSGIATRILYNNAGVVGEYVISGTGNVAMTTSPVFTTPALGTPSALILTNATGLVTAGINASQVTLAKIQNATANSKLLGSGAAGSGAAYVELTLGSGLTMTGTTLSSSGGGGSPGGSTTQIQYNNAGSFAGSVNLTWDNANNVFTVGDATGFTTPSLLVDGVNDQVTLASSSTTDATFLIVGGGTVSMFGGTNNTTFTLDDSARTYQFNKLNTSNNKLVTVDSSGKINSNGGSQTLASNFTTSSVTAVSTNLTFAIAANETYTVTIIGTVQKATAITGMKVGIGAPIGCTLKGWAELGGATFATALALSSMTAVNTLGTTFATGIGIEVPFRLQFQVTNSTTPGSITFQAATVTSNTVTVFAGTQMTYIKGTAL